MKSPRNNELEINISVIGLSGSDRIKGSSGVGKSCLCNRLAQPKNYKSKHNFLVSTIDMYSDEMKNKQCIYWGSIDRHISGRVCRFRFIEQTVLMEDMTQCDQTNNERYIDRATATELCGLKYAHVIDSSQYGCPAMMGHNYVNLFMLVYDVSDVHNRDPNVQDTMFCRLFDHVLITKRPLIVVATKYDNSLPELIRRLSNILEQPCYQNYAVVETSACLGVNMEILFDLSVVLCCEGHGTLSYRLLSFNDAQAEYMSRQEQGEKELRMVVWSVCEKERLDTPWSQGRLLPLLQAWVEGLGAERVADVCEEVRMEVQEMRRAYSRRRYEDILIQVLQESHHRLPATFSDVTSVIQCLFKDPVFIGHFIEFNDDAEYFDFDANVNLLPYHILDENNENNMIFVVKEYMDRKMCEDLLFQRLVNDGPGNFRKSFKEICDDLTRYMNNPIDEQTIDNVHKRFRQHYLKILESQFLETILENPYIFWARKINQLVDVSIDKPWTIDDISINPDNVKLPLDDAIFLSGVVNDINSNIRFSPLSVAEDTDHLRESWIYKYLRSLRSDESMECLYRHVTGSQCSSAIICDIFSMTDLEFTTNADNIPHVYYITIIGDSRIKDELRDLIVSVQHTWTLERCKLHFSENELQLLDSLQSLQDSVSELMRRNAQYCGACVFLCGEDTGSQADHLVQLCQIEQTCSYNISKYIVYNVINELVKITVVGDDSVSTKMSHDLDVVHINTLISTCRPNTDSSIIWVVSVCGDRFKLDSVLTRILSVLQLHSSPRRLDSSFVTLSGCFTSEEVSRHMYQLCFIPHHQAIKLLIGGSPTQTLDGLLLICSLDRLASINTCLGIRKYLPEKLKSSCHCMLLGVAGYRSTLSEYARVEALNHNMKYGYIALDTSQPIAPNFRFEEENQISDFLISIFIRSPITVSTADIPTVSTSLIPRSETGLGVSSSTSNQNIHGQCDQCDGNILNISRVTKSDHDSSVIISYDQVLGETNADLFDDCSPEFTFHWAQDICNSCTKVKCSDYQHLDTEVFLNQPFRQRIRSKSGPDLRSYLHSNKSSLSKSNSSSTYCNTCNINSIHDSKKCSVNKESPSKRLSAIFQDLFSPIRRFNESQSNDSRKPFIRTTSKKRK